MDDHVIVYNDYLLYFLILLGLQFFTTYIPRVSITTATINKIRSGKISFRTLIIGSDEVAMQTYKAIVERTPNAGNCIVGYIKMAHDDPDVMGQVLPCCGTIDQLVKIVKEQEIEKK